MDKHLQQILNELRAEGKDYTHFKVLFNAIKASGLTISKDDILEFVANDYRIQLHTTPNSIAKLISHLAQASQPKSAIDICCGTGNILYYLQNEIDDLIGVEISENVAELTKYFIPELHIITADTFLYPFTSKYDLVVGNIPFGMGTELDGKRIPCEEAFLRKAHELINENGRAIILVPYSVLSTGQFQNFRNGFLNYLQEVIALPLENIRSVQIKTALIILGKRETNEIKLTQLRQFENLQQEYVKAEHTTHFKEQLVERWDPAFHLTKENSFYKELENIQTKELQDLAEIIKGKLIPANILIEQGEYLYLKPVHIQNNRLSLESSLKYVAKESIKEQEFRYILQTGDIVISTIFNDLKMYVYQEGDIPAIASNNLAIIRSSKQDYIHTYLQTDEGKRIFKTQAEDLRIGVTIPHLNLKDLAKIKIPILPVADLNSLGNKSIETSSKRELQNQIEYLRGLFPEPVNQVNESEMIYGDSKTSQTQIILTFMADRFKKIETQLGIVNEKLDTLLKHLVDLRTDFDQVRALHRNDDEKLFKLCQKIDTRLETIYTNERVTIDGYIEEIKRWLDLWELLDSQSKKYLPIAEFIFDELCKIPEADYAPFVVQYCRTLENEILKKLFEAYHGKGLLGVNRDELAKMDLENSKTGKFAQMVRRNKMTYTLGEMNFIMALLKQGGTTLAESPLLQHFRSFTILYFDEKIVEAEFLNDINKLTNDFRNKAAHPYSMGVDLAKECQGLLRKSLNVFLDSVKNSKDYEK